VHPQILCKHKLFIEKKSQCNNLNCSKNRIHFLLILVLDVTTWTCNNYLTFGTGVNEVPNKLFLPLWMKFDRAAHIFESVYRDALLSKQLLKATTPFIYSVLSQGQLCGERFTDQTKMPGAMLTNHSSRARTMFGFLPVQKNCQKLLFKLASTTYPFPFP